MTYEDILFDSKDGIARITINRPSVTGATRFAGAHVRSS